MASSATAPSTQINDANVGQLGLAWSYATGTTRGLQATPIVVDGRMYATGVWSVVYALDAKTGKQLWKYDPDVPRAWGRYACCDVVNRGVALWGDALFVGTLDGRLVSLDAKTGKKRWEVNTIDRTKPYTITGAPRVVKGKVLIGNGGGEYGVRGYFSAYDARTGKLAWRFYTVPGNPKDGFETPELEKAAKTWNGEWWLGGGGGTVWDSMAYDPELDTLYVGTGNGSPWARAIRSPGGGDNLYLSSILAIDPDNGKLKWHYQVTPADNWDYTATQHIVLADLLFDGKPRKVLMQAPKNGFFYVLDRVSGELLVGGQVHPGNLGEPRRPPDRTAGRNRRRRLEPRDTADHPGAVRRPQLAPDGVQPEHGAGLHPGDAADGHLHAVARIPHDRQVHAARDVLEPRRRLERIHEVDLRTVAAVPGLAAARPWLPESWDPVARRTRWEIEHPAFWNGGLLTTAGNLLFQGTGDGRFVAYAADTGRTLWSMPTMVGIVAPPVTYAIDGEQYVAVLAGYGGAGAVTGGDPRTMASGKYLNEGHILAFKLGGNAAMPRIAERNQDIPEPPAIEATAAQVENGKYAYTANCMVCHGALAVSGGVTPDLRRLSAENTRSSSGSSTTA